MSAVAEHVDAQQTSDAAAIDDLDGDTRHRWTLMWVAALVALLVATIVVAVGLGPVAIAPATVAQIITHHLFGAPSPVSWSLADDNIVWLVRMPRVLLGTVVGAGLAVCGVALQALVRNVLVDPFLLGTSSGASTGAATSILSAWDQGAARPRCRRALRDIPRLGRRARNAFQPAELPSGS